MIERARVELAERLRDLLGIGQTAGEHRALLLVREEDVDAEVLRDREEARHAHLADHLERAEVKGQRRAAGLREKRCCPGSCARRVGEERPGGEVQVPRPADDVTRQLGFEQVEVGSVPRHHRALAGVVDEHGHRAGEMGVGLDEVGDDLLTFEVLLGELAEPVPADLADELGCLASSGWPRRPRWRRCRRG